MPAYVVVNVRVKDPVRYEDYKKMAPASIAQYGGHYIARGGAVHVMEGDWKPERLVLLEFPSVERAREWWGCAEYADAKALRNATSDTQLVITEGL